MPDATGPIRRRMASAVGPVRRDLLSRSSSWLITSAFKSRKVTCSSSSRSASSNSRVSEAAGDRAPTEPRDDGVAVEHDARQRLAYSIGDDAAQAYRQAFFKHDDALGVLQRLAQRGERERAERADGDRTDARAALAHLIDDFLNGAVHRAERDHDRLRVLGAVGSDESAGVAAELLVEFRGKLRNQSQRPQLFVVRQVAHLGECLGSDQGADAHRVCRIENLPRLVPRQERIDLFLRRHVDTFIRVGQDEAVHADHHRTRELLGEAERLDVQVQRFLVGFRVKLDPAGVAHRHAVGMVVPDVDRRADRAVADRHHDR